VILYSIIPSEVVFGGAPGAVDNNYLEMEYLGEKVQVSALSNSQYVIQRVISTSPKAFLNPKLQPGAIVAR